MSRSPRIRVHAFSVSADGYGAGPDQSLENPLGVGGRALHGWAMGTRTFRRMFGMDGGDAGVDDDFAVRSFEDIGAWVMGRNMFAHSRGPWVDDGWKGWWGDDPPYHVPVFVLTHHAREPLVMEGGTVFHFVTDGLEAALARAKAAAGDQDVRIGGGASTIRQALRARLVDEMHLALSPALLGRGESLLADLDLPALGYGITRHVNTAAAMHLVIGRTGEPATA
jgi:dihydrofolate reductase